MPMRAAAFSRTRCTPKPGTRAPTDTASGLPSSMQSLNPELRRRLRKVEGHGRARSAFVAGAVDGGDTIPVMMAGLYRGITIGRREQRLGGQQFTFGVLLLAAID